MIVSESWEELVSRGANGGELSRAESAQVFDALMTGRIPPEDIEHFLRGLAKRGETVEEIVGAAGVMRRHVTPIRCEALNAIDTCGTGGDGISTFNVSTAAAIIASAAGAVVAKHGNRTNSRASGSAEVLTALGVCIEASPAVVEKCIREIGIGFLFAAQLHPAMAIVKDVRRKIGTPTIFNLLGPLTNPANVRRQIIGVPRVDLVDKVAASLAVLGAERAFVVHGHDGLCDLTICEASTVAEVRDGRVTVGTICPEDAGLGRGRLDELRVKSPDESAEVIREILDGQTGPRRDHALLNAGLALVAAGVAGDLSEGVTSAGRAIDIGTAREKLARLAETSGKTA